VQNANVQNANVQNADAQNADAQNVDAQNVDAQNKAQPGASVAAESSDAAGAPRWAGAQRSPKTGPSDSLDPKAARSDTAEPAVGWIGISMKQSEDGVVVAGVLRNGPAALAGVVSGDRLLRINGQSVGTPADVGGLVQTLTPGSRVTFDVRRNDATRLLYGTVEEKPDREVLLRRELVGHPAPSISELRTVQGAVVPSWAQLQGHVVVLEFWASWCMACRALAPTLNDWHEEFSALGVHVLGITMDPFEEAVRASEALAFPTYSDEDGQVTMRYQGTALPTLVLVDKQGVVTDVMVGLNFEQLPKFKERVEALANGAR
jgi:thiol-disulfide isomerase/thioredoxin